MQVWIRSGRLAAAFALWLALAPVATASVESELAFHRGVVAYGENRLDEAQRQFEIALKADPEDTVTLHYLALIAQKRGDLAGAIEIYQRSVAADPEDADLQMDLGLALLEAGRPAEARQAFDKAAQLDPKRARAQLMAGVAAYRAGSYAEAKPYFDRAAALDPDLQDEARYYQGLSNAYLGDLEGAATAFGEAVQQSPLSPLGQSAQNFQRALAKPPAPERRWHAAMTAGMEYDSNPLIVGDSIFVPGADPDGRGVVRVSADYRWLSTEHFNFTSGYDSYWSFQINENEVNLQTHNPWLSAGYDLGRVRLGLRYDYAFTFVDTTDPFRHFHRVTPSIAVREGDWGVSFLNYQFRYQDFLRHLVEPSVFNRDGTGNIAGFDQFFFLPKPFTYVRLGGHGDWLRTDGTEWSYNGVGASFGAGYNFDYDISLSWLYRFTYRHYLDPSALAYPVPFTQYRNDYEHMLTASIAKGITEHWEVSAGCALTWNTSDVRFYQYDRQVGGAYVTYRF